MSPPVLQDPLVGSDLNEVLLKMVEESVEDRASFDDVTKACRQHPLERTSTEEEVDRLVTYVMGDAPEVMI